MQRNPIGLAHKYRGKKPYFLSHYVVSNYTKENDVILDPFCGSGSLVIDGIFQNRRLLGVDINPSSVHFNKVIVNGAKYSQLSEARKQIKTKLDEMELKFYGYKGGIIRSIVREKEGDNPIAIMLKDKTEYTQDIHGIDDIEYDFERIHSGFDTELVRNSRLSVKDGMKVKDFFTDLSLACHNEILNTIYDFDDDVRDFFKVAFTANIANCSKLLPPIKSRGLFAPGAWMTGYYVAKQYLENNVFHYYKNRVNKLLKAKEYFEKEVQNQSFGTIKDVLNDNAKYSFSVGNAMDLNIPDNSIDIIITDPPYEGAVPYLEQSMIRNAFWNDNIDLENEIIVSDAKYREKKHDRFLIELGKSFMEFNRVLKNGSKLILTYNSIKIDSLNSFSSTLSDFGFNVVDVVNVTQKSATPRQINRGNTVKGDLLIISEKQKTKKEFIFTEGLLSRLENINHLNYKTT